eukprot:SAG31_NODE_1233_length_9206_cov_32.480290_1_plen_349_part_00
MRAAARAAISIPRRARRVSHHHHAVTISSSSRNDPSRQMRVSATALAFAVAPLARCVAPSRPAHAANITIYHVNPRQYGALPFNMDVGDSLGDLYFVMRSVAGPIECAADPHAEDCTDEEVTSSSLIASKLVVEIDNRTGPYGHCNICTNVSKSLYHPCSAEEVGTYKCSGRMLNRDKVGMEMPALAHRTDCSVGAAAWECWRNRIALKFGGTWWSFFNESYCSPTGPDLAAESGACSWRVVKQGKSIANNCLMDRVFTSIEVAAPSCFKACSTAGVEAAIVDPSNAARNTSDPCWIKCIYGTVLGVNASQPGNESQWLGGMPTAPIVKAWEAAFGDGPRACPAVLVT